MHTPLVSVIVVNYNGFDVIERCLRSILSSSYPHLEIVVFDNGSVDGSQQLILRKYGADPKLTVVANESNLGFAEGCNLGVSKANGEYLVFLNNDTEVRGDAIQNLVAALGKSPSIGAAQGKLLLMSDKKRLDGTGDIISTIGWPHSQGKYEIDKGQYDSVREVFGARGAAMIVRKSVFEEVGGFDPDYFMYYEDLDLSWRIRLRGYTILFIPQSVVYHLGGAAFESTSGRQVSSNLYSGRNYIATLVKNLELRNLFIYGPVHIVVHLFTIAFYLWERRVHEALGLMLALPRAIVDFPRMWRKRQLVQRLRVVSDEKLFGGFRRVSMADYLRTHVDRRMLARRTAIGLRVCS